jgi:hypothetical protein
MLLLAQQYLPTVQALFYTTKSIEAESFDVNMNVSLNTVGCSSCQPVLELCFGG